VGRGGAAAPFVRVRLSSDAVYVSTGDISASQKALASLLAGRVTAEGVPLIRAHVEVDVAEDAPAVLHLLV